MERTRIKCITSLLLTFMLIFAPLGMLRAADGVDAVVSVSYGSVNIEKITNSSSKPVTGWTITIKGVPASATVGSKWNASVTLKDGTLTFKSTEDWNSNIEPGASVTASAGCYLDGISEDWKPSSITVTPTFGAVNPPPKPTETDPSPVPPKPSDPTPVPPKPTETDPTPVPPKPTETDPEPVKPSETTPAPVETTKAPAETTPAPETTGVPTETTTENTEPSDTSVLSLEPVDGDDWLTTVGNRIVDKNGTQVWLTGVNWFGYNTGTNIFDGCWNCNMETALRSIADHGFNLLRIPMSAELVLAWKNGEYPEANYNKATNAELEGKNSQQIFDYALMLCQRYGLKVMLDIHSANSDAAGHMTNLWYTDKVSLQGYYDAVQYLADRYKDNDTVIALDLKNEPHGKANEDKAIWNDSDLDNNWKHVAEVAGNLALDANPNLLIVIEGIEIYPKDINANKDFSSTNMDDYLTTWWGANLRGVKDYPIDFGSEARNRQIVYSPHDYGPTVYQQPWFEGEFTYNSLKTDCWNDNWLYIHNERIAPILIGEWGGFMTEPNLTWMTYLRQLIGENHLNFTFWCYNSNSGDTGGLVLDDFTTWDDAKYAFVKEVLWQQDDKFVGLDHAVPLGNRGISLSEYNGVIDPDNVPSETTAPATSAPDAVETEAPAETTKVAAAATAAAKKSGGFPVGKIVLYGFLFLLLLLIAVLLYMFFKNPKAWNNLVDRLHLPEKLKRDIPWEMAPQTAEVSEPASTNNAFAGRYRPVARTSPANGGDASAAKTNDAAAKASTSPRSSAAVAGAAAATKSAFKPAPDASGQVKRPNMRPSARSQVRSVEELEAEVNRLAEEMKAEEARKAAEAAKAEESAAKTESVLDTAVKAEPEVNMAPKAEEEVEDLLLSAAPLAPAASVNKDDDDDIPSIVRSLREQERAAEAAKTEEPVAPNWASAPTLDRPIWAKPNDPVSSDVSDVYAPDKTEKPERKGPIKRPNMRPSAKKPDDPKNDIK